MRLLPKCLKIITNAPQIPENKWSFSPDAQNPCGPSNELSGKPLEWHKVPLNIVSTGLKLPGH